MNDYTDELFWQRNVTKSNRYFLKKYITCTYYNLFLDLNFYFFSADSIEHLIGVNIFIPYFKYERFINDRVLCIFFGYGI